MKMIIKYNLCLSEIYFINSCRYIYIIGFLRLWFIEKKFVLFILEYREIDKNYIIRLSLFYKKIVSDLYL